MVSSETLKLPAIDFTKPGAVNPGSPEWNSMKFQVKEALREYGCFEVLYNKVPQEVREGFFGAVEELFDLPTDTKRLNVPTKPFNGYLERNPTVFEGLGIEDVNILAEVENFTNTLWPQGNPNVSKAVHSFSKHVVELDGIVRRMLLESSGIEKYWEEHMDSTTYRLRVMRYLPSQRGEESHIAVVPHTDKTLTTLLHENDVGGLEVQSKQGDWISAKLSPDSFLFMVGDALYAWANGHLHIGIHRVTMRGNKTRYSAGLFSIPKAGYKFKVPDELVDEKHPLLFKPFEFFEYLDFYCNCYTKKLGVKAELPIEDYCGI